MNWRIRTPEAGRPGNPQGPTRRPGPVGSMLRGAAVILLGKERAPRPRGSNWREDWVAERVLPAGTVLWKGTSDANATPGQPSPFTWFTTDKALATRFSTMWLDEYDLLDEEAMPMVHEYVLERDLGLPFARSEREILGLYDRYGISDAYAAATRHDAMNSGLPGWVALGCYAGSQGDDILIGDVSVLSYRRSFDRSGADIGHYEPASAPGMGQ